MSHDSAREAAVEAITSWTNLGRRAPKSATPVTQLFGMNVFSDDVMRARLPENVYRMLRNTVKKGAPLDPSVADVAATAMKEWAMERGATHYTHWFQPMTGLTAEKHDSFLAPCGLRHHSRNRSDPQQKLLLNSHGLAHPPPRFDGALAAIHAPKPHLVYDEAAHTPGESSSEEDQP